MVVIDVETTGGSKEDRVCEVGIATVDLLVSEPRLVMAQLVDPGRPVHPAASRVHGIRDADLRGAPTWSEVEPAVRMHLGRGTLAAYGASFDRRFLVAEGIGDLPPLGDWLDPLRLCKRVDREAKSHTLSDACLRRNIVVGGHRAGADAMAAAQLLVAMLRELAGALPATVGDLLEWLAAPAERARPAPPPPRRAWKVTGGGHSGRMWLKGRRHDEGPWWVLSAGHGATYTSHEEAVRAATWSGGRVVEVTPDGAPPRQVALVAVGDPCPECANGRIRAGNTMLGCNRWQDGCGFRAPMPERAA